MEIPYKRMTINEYLEEVKSMMDLLGGQMDSFIDELYQACVDDRSVFFIGNGGSAANASHFCQDLSKGVFQTFSAARRFRAVSLTDNVSFLTALANDEGYENVFAQQLVALSCPEDILVAISGSGNSPNILRAVDYANEFGMKTIGMTGFDGGELKKKARVNVHIPSDDMGLVEAVHAVVFHIAISQLHQRFTPID